MITIEKNIEVPDSTDYEKYPFSQMEIGDSFKIKNDKKKLSRLRGLSFYYAKKNNVKFTTRKDGDGYRIWRTA